MASIHTSIQEQQHNDSAILQPEVCPKQLLEDCLDLPKLSSPPLQAVVIAHVISLKIPTQWFLSNLSRHFHLIAFQER